MAVPFNKHPSNKLIVIYSWNMSRMNLCRTFINQNYSYVNSPTKLNATISVRIRMYNLQKSVLLVSWICRTVLIAVLVLLCFTVIMWSGLPHFTKKTLFLFKLLLIQTTHTGKQINCLKPLKHMALCLIHNKQNISPICCRRAKRRVRKFKNESLLWLALYSVIEKRVGVCSRL